MKTKLTAPILLTVICLLLVAGGTSHAQPLDGRQPIRSQTITNTVYLPIVTKPPCAWVHPTAYVAVSRPIVKIGDLVTVTGAIMNDCARVDKPDGRLLTTPEGLLSPSFIITDLHAGSMPYGSYKEFTFTVQAVQSGIVNIAALSTYETQNPDGSWWWGSAESAPAVIRILP